MRQAPQSPKVVWYLIPLVAVVLGLVFIGIANTLATGLDSFFYFGGLMLVFIGVVIGGLLSLVIYFVRRKA